MATAIQGVIPNVVTSESRETYPPGGLRFDWINMLLALLWLGGLYIDGWAHNHGKVDNTFFTPWHAILYSTFGLIGIFLTLNAVRNLTRGYKLRRALPEGYVLSLLGVLVFAFAGVFDFFWHSVFGFEANTAALLSPAHLFLALGFMLVMSGPLRSRWLSIPAGSRPTWREAGPLIGSAICVLAVLSFFTQFAHPVDNVMAAGKASNFGSASDLYLMNADGSGQTRLTINTQLAYIDPVISPDGKKIVYRAGQHDADISDLFVMNADGSGTPTQITHDLGWQRTPSFSPDGKTIAFIASGAGVTDHTELYTASLDGSNLTRLTTTPNGWRWGTSWSPDGKQITYSSNQTGNWAIYTMNADGSNPVRLTQSSTDNYGPSWSPDGKLIAFTGSQDDAEYLFTIKPDGSGLTRVGDKPGSLPHWSPDGKRLSYLGTVDGIDQVFVINADGSGAANLTRNTALSSDSPIWTPDGAKIIFTAGGHTASASESTLQAYGIASILLQSGLVIGMLLWLTRRWRLPVGAVALIIIVINLLASVFSDRYFLLPGIVVAALIAEVLYALLKPTAEKPGRFALFAFLTPVVFYSAYFLNLQLTRGVSWVIHVWAGSIIMAGVAGLLISFLMVWPQRQLNATERPAT